MEWINKTLRAWLRLSHKSKDGIPRRALASSQDLQMQFFEGPARKGETLSSLARLAVTASTGLPAQCSLPFWIGNLNKKLILLNTSSGLFFIVKNNV